MKIFIKDDKSEMTLCFPTGLVINRLTAGIIRRKLKKEGVLLTRKQTVLFIKELKKYKKKHRDWNLVEISENGTNSVIIKI